jgi:hypothetical protein
MSKGSSRRPSQISREESELRWSLFGGLITREEFDRQYAELLKQGKITRGGRVIYEDDTRSTE